MSSISALIQELEHNFQFEVEIYINSPVQYEITSMDVICYNTEKTPRYDGAIYKELKNKILCVNKRSIIISTSKEMVC